MQVRDLVVPGRHAAGLVLVGIAARRNVGMRTVDDGEGLAAMRGLQLGRARWPSSRTRSPSRR